MPQARNEKKTIKKTKGAEIDRLQLKKELRVLKETFEQRIWRIRDIVNKEIRHRAAEAKRGYKTSPYARTTLIA